jgi:hypothetical protein
MRTSVQVECACRQVFTADDDRAAAPRTPGRTPSDPSAVTSLMAGFT